MAAESGWAMRYIIYGAGAVGGTIGGRLALAGHDVILICRGAHYDAVRANGLLLQTPEPEGETLIPIAAVNHPREIAFAPGDCVILTTKTQHTEGALSDLEAAAGTDIPVVCAQNGVENERLAARRFRNVYGMLVNLPATHLVPGEVIAAGTPLSGVLHAGRYPDGVDATIKQVCADISASHFVADADPAIMRIKYAKLLQNLSNAADVAIGRPAAESPEGVAILRETRQEAARVLAAAGIEVSPPDEVAARVQRHYSAAAVGGMARAASSTLQSVMRGHTTIEVDYLNGEIILLGRLYGVPVPLNAVLRRVATAIAAKGEGGNPIPVAELAALIEQERQASDG